jgi:hypothetical protein
MAINQLLTGMKTGSRLRLHYLIYSLAKFRSIPIYCGCYRGCQSLNVVPAPEIRELMNTTSLLVVFINIPILNKNETSIEYHWY